MKRKIIYSLAITFSFSFLGLTCVNATESTPAECFGIEPNGDGIAITNYNNDRYAYCNNHVVIPSTINEQTVNAINDAAFYSIGISSVIIPDTVTSIGPLAFADNYISTVNLSENVTYLGYGAFNYNPFKLDGEEVPVFFYERTDTNHDGIAEINTKKLVSVGWNGFDDLDIPNSVEIIASKALSYLEIYDLFLPEGLTTIESKGLWNSFIYEMHIPASLTSADLSLNSDEMYDNIIYQNWNDNNTDLPYTFTPGTANIVHNNYYLTPMIFYWNINSVSYNKIKFTWDTYEEISGVEIYKYNTSTEEYDLYYNTTNYSTLYSTKDLITGTTYKFKLKPYTITPDNIKHYGETTTIKSVTPIPSAPTNFKATKYRSKTAKLSWNKVEGATGYSIYKYSSKTKKYYYIKSTLSTSTITNYGNYAGKGYYYKVKAYKVVNGKKIYSNYSASKYVKV